MFSVKKLFATGPSWLAVLSIVGLMAIAISCGSSDEPAAAARVEPTIGESKNVVDSGSVRESVVDNEREPISLEEAVVPSLEPVRGSNESAILNVFRLGVQALNEENYAAFAALCDPRLAKPFTAEQVKFTWETFAKPSFDSGTTNYRNAEMRIFDDGTAMVEADSYSNDQPAVEALTESFNLVDGDWYSNSIFCHGGNNRLVEPPVEELTQDVADRYRSETRAQPVAEFPAEIAQGAERLDSDEVLAHWREFLAGTRQIVFKGSLIMEWCSNGKGTWVYEVGTPAFTGATFDYEVVSDPGGSWNTIVAIVKLHDPKLFDLMNYAGGNGFRVGLAPSGVLEDWEAYDSPTCT
ncbi:MAG: hypothetical protein O3B95_06035 [Chloroflexi bacterium]|nr:hypothetical protein [Chloroflexota bacterium]